MTPRTKHKQNAEVKSRGEVGQVSWQALRDGSLRLNIPKKYSIDKKKQFQKRLGMKDTAENRAIADLITARLNERITTGNYNPEKVDEYIKEYKRLYTGVEDQLPSPKGSEPVKNKTLTLDQLWELFCQYKAPLVKQTTFNTVFSVITSHISKLETKDLGKGDAILAELSQQIKSKSALYRTLSYLSNCCDWAVSRDKILKNPFKLSLEDLKQPQTDFNPDPFTREEMGRVIKAYEKHSHYHCYAFFVQFRFLTGCRIGEAVGLKWKDVHLKENYIEFHETITTTNKGPVHQEGTKTEPFRKFPIKSSLRQLLEEQKFSKVDPDDYVFLEPDGGHIKYDRFHRSWYGYEDIWNLKDGTKKKRFYEGIVTQLANLPEEEGGIDHYRPPYSPRHTFITLALDKLARKREVKLSDVAQLADYVGNSTSTIFEHYLGKSGDSSIVDIDEDEPESTSIVFSKSVTQPSTETVTQLISSKHLVEQLVQQITQLTQQNQLLQQQLARLHPLQPSPQPSGQQESAIPSDSDLAQLALLLTVNNQIESKSVPPS